MFGTLKSSDTFYLTGICDLKVVSLRYAWQRPSQTAKKADRSDMFGLAEMAFGAGAVAGPLIGGYVYDQFAPPIVFYLNASVVLVSILIFLVWVGKGVKHD